MRRHILFKMGGDILNDTNVVQPKYWTFIFEEPNNGWWLKISNANDLICYHLNSSNIYEKALMDYIHNKDKYEEIGGQAAFDHTITYAIVKFAEQRNLTIFEAIIQFRIMAVDSQLEAIRENGYILLNKIGGFHSGPVDYSQFIQRKTFTWPDFKESDIKIVQFTGGTHYYVHIGEMELHDDEGNIKWMSESDARIAAMKYISKENSNG